MKVKPLEIIDGYLTETNPLRGLSMKSAVALLEDGERGIYSELMWLFRFVEKRDAVLRGAKNRMQAAIGKFDWDIKIVSRVPAGMEKAAELQVAALREAYEAIDNLEEAKQHLVSAQFRGFAHLEKHYAADGTVTHLEPVPQWHWCRRGINGEWKFNADARVGVKDGTAIDLENFIIREIEDPIDEIALLAYVDKEFAKSGWSKAVKRHGLPFVFWVMSEAVAATLANDPAKLEAWRNMVSQISNDHTGMFPGGDIKMLDIKSGELPHKDRIAALNEEIVIAATSGKLTMLNEATGLGSGNADAHVDTFEELAENLAMKISEDFQSQFDKIILAEKFPNQPVLAYFSIAAKDEEDVAQYIGNVKLLKEAGYKVVTTEVAEKTGYELEEIIDSPPKPNQPNQEPQQKATKVKNRAAAPIDRTELIMAAAAEDFTPLRKKLLELLSIDDDALFSEAAKQLDAELPALYQSMLAESGALGEALSDQAMINILKGATEATNLPS